MSQIKQIKDAIDIVQVIGERVELKRSGTNLKGLCPFHSEKSPSFFVSDQLQRYRCFGCGESGDVFNFLEKYEGMSFSEALHYLADQAGITIEEYKASPQDELRDRVLEILSLTKDYYHYLLTEHKAGEMGRDYLKQRGINSESIKIFQLGFALPGWDGLIKYLHKKKKYNLSDIEAAGLIIRGKNGGYYDRFRGRLIFPLTNHRGQVVGFSGRSLEKDVKSAKYINSPETIVYHKSELLYGFSQLYQHIRKAEEVILAEGEMDVISSAQAHVNNIVAIKGSALTREQLQLLRRTVNKILLSLDMDSAGIEATKRAITLAKEFNIELRVLQLPKEDDKPAKDPDDLARENPKAWREVAKSSISVYEFFLQNAVTLNDQSTPEGKRKIIDELAPIFGEIQHEVESDFYIKKLATILAVKDEVVRRDIIRFKDKSKLSSRKVGKLDSSEQQVASSKQKNRREKLEEYLLFLFFRGSSEQAVGSRSNQLLAISFQTVGFSQIIDAIGKWRGDFDLAKFTSTLPGDLQQIVSDVYLHPQYVEIVDEIDFAEEWRNTFGELKKMSAGDEIKEIAKELDKLDELREKTPEQEDRQAELLQRIVLLKRKN